MQIGDEAKALLHGTVLHREIYPHGSLGCDEPETSTDNLGKLVRTNPATIRPRETVPAINFNVRLSGFFGEDCRFSIPLSLLICIVVPLVLHHLIHEIAGAA